MLQSCYKQEWENKYSFKNVLAWETYAKNNGVKSKEKKENFKPIFSLKSLLLSNS